MNELLKADLSLFEGDGGNASAEGPATAGETTEKASYTGRGKKGDYSNVVFGKQPETANIEATEDNAGAADQNVTQKESTEDRSKRFKEMINGEFKDLYTEETQRIINNRFKQTKELEAANERSKALYNMLADKYGVDANDVDGIINAVNNDNQIWQEKADEAGLTIDQYKQMQKLKRENEELLRQQASRTNEERAQAQLLKWNQEAEALKQTFPGFDLNAEAQNPQFVAMLRAGTPVEVAYKALHFDEINAAVAKSTAQAAEKRVTDNIRARGMRPTESGTASRSAFTVKDDVSKLTKADRAEIARRAARGDHIEF